jgi:hypothetical protein
MQLLAIHGVVSAARKNKVDDGRIVSGLYAMREKKPRQAGFQFPHTTQVCPGAQCNAGQT